MSPPSSNDARPVDLPELIGGRYRVVGEIGRGGMGRVLKVVHLHTGETLAMKVLVMPSAGRDRAIERFGREARSLAQVRGDHIVRIMDADLAPELGGAPYLVMEMLSGEDLGRYVRRRGRLQPPEASALLLQVALGLARVHNAGLVHRDLKPANIFLHDADGRLVVKLLDFGLVRPVSGADGSLDAVTGQGEILGTPLFMSPEQVHGRVESVGAPTDIWAAGIVAYYLLTGQPYWNLLDLPRGIFDIGASPLTPPSLLDPSLTVAFDAWFLRSCARNPAARWPDPLVQWQELARALGLPADAAGSAVFSTAPPIPASTDETHVAGPHPTPRSTSAADGSAARQRRQVTVLFYRLSHSGQSRRDAEMDPEEFEASEATLHARLDAALGDLRQTGNQVARGGRFVFFGYPIAFGSDARRAVEAGLRLTELAADLDQELRTAGRGGLQIRIGIHTGVVIAGPSTEMPGGISVVGQALGVATDLEHQAAAGQVLVSDATWRLLAGRFEARDLGEGRHAITRVSAESTGGADRTAMIGRHAELGILQGCLEEARRGESQMVLVTGEVGIGKSRLVDALRTLPEAADVDWLACQCSPFFQRTAFHPALDLLRHVIARATGHPESAAVTASDVAAMVHAIGLDTPIAESLEFLLSLPGGERSAVAALSPHLRRERAIQALLSVIHRLALATPVVLVVEDLHWADPSTLEWLDRLSMLKDARVLTVVTARPEFSPSWSTPAAVIPVQLRRLGQAQTAQLIAAVAGAAVPPAVADLVARTTDGIPLFIEELTRVVTERPESASAGAISAGSVPTTLGEALNARLDRLGSARSIAELASVIGPTFAIDDVRALAGDDVNVAARIQELVRAKIVQPLGLPPHTQYAFHHALVREAAYASVPREARRALHLRVAQTLAARSSAAAEVLAHHFEEAGLPMEAAGLLLQAGQAALGRSANAEARAHFQRGAALLAAPAAGPRAVDPSLEITLRTMHGMAWVVSRGYSTPEAEVEFAGAMKLVQALGDRVVPGCVPALFANWVFHFVTGRVDEAAALGARLRRAAEQSKDAGELMMALLADGTVCLEQGRLQDAIARFDDALSRYDPAAHTPYRFIYGQDPRMYGLVFKAWALWSAGDPDAARQTVEAAVTHTRGLSHPHSLGFALSLAAIVHHYRGDLAELDRDVAELTALSAEQGWMQWLGFARLYSGAADVLRGRVEPGVAEMGEARALAMAIGEKAGASHYEAVFADGLIRLGRLDEALERLSAVQRDVVAKGQRAFEADLVRLEGEIARLRGDTTLARDRFERAHAMAVAGGSRSYALRAALSLARLGGEGTTERLAQALDAITGGDDTADVRSARAMG